MRSLRHRRRVAAAACSPPLSCCLDLTEVQLAPGSAQRWAPVPKQPSTPTVPAARRAARLSAVAAAAAAQPTARMRQPPPGGGRGAGPPSLHAICLGVLAEHLDELIECGEDVLPLLPAPAKASLLAVARLRRLLSDAALALLADCEHTILDLRGCGDLVSDAGVRAALRGMPHLRLADLSSCPVGPVTLRALGEACPAVEVLRLGSAATDQGAGRCAVRGAGRGVRRLRGMGQRASAPGRALPQAGL